MTILVTFADSSGGISALGFNGKDFLIQLITFLLAYFVLKRYAFNPIIKALRHRKEVIESGVKLEEQLREEKEQLVKTTEKTMYEARAKADELIASAQDAARQTVRDAEEQARSKSAKILEDAETRITQTTNQARRKLEGQLVGLISEVTEAVIEQKVDTKKDEQLIEKAIKERQSA